MNRVSLSKAIEGRKSCADAHAASRLVVEGNRVGDAGSGAGQTIARTGYILRFRPLKGVYLIASGTGVKVASNGPVDGIVPDGGVFEFIFLLFSFFFFCATAIRHLFARKFDAGAAHSKFGW